MYTYDILIFNPMHDLRIKTKISPSGSVEVVVIVIVGIIIRFHDRGYKRSNDMRCLFLANALNCKLSMGNLLPTK
jgi:hypothetical protein